MPEEPEDKAARLKQRQWRRFWLAHVVSSGFLCLIYCPHHEEVQGLRKHIFGPKPTDR